MKGTVKWFNDNKGYGFISGEDGQEYYVHASMLGADVFLKEGNAVSFEPKTSDKGLQATQVTIAA
jgi:CspA family cold shock protein